MAGNRAINYQELHRQYQLDPFRAHNHLTECLRTKQLKATDFSIRELAEATVKDGREWVRSLNPGKSGYNVPLLEAGGAVSTNHFTSIFGQVIYSRVVEFFENEAFVFSKEVDTVPSKFPFGERVPRIGPIGNEAALVPEGTPYPNVGISEDYLDAPPGEKRGMIVPVTKEAVFFDNTGQVLTRAGEVGNWMGYNKEVRIIDAFIDQNETRHRYRWRGTQYGTYQTSTPWVNDTASGLALVDWTDVNAAWILLSQITDPLTGTPVLVIPDCIVVCPQLVATARYIMQATDVRMHAAGYPTSGNLSETVSPSPIDTYRIVSSRILFTRSSDASDWYLSNIRKQVTYFENWPITVTQAPPNSHDEFHKDIVSQFKVSERGAAFVMEPRAGVRSQA